MDAFTPAQTTELVARIGSKKAQMNYVKLFFNACVGGALLGFGSALALSTEAAPWFATNAPGLLRTIGAFVFPAGLTMIILTGTDLATSNFLYMPVALLTRRITVLDLLINWTISFFGNLAGMLFFAIIITGYGGTFSTGAYRDVALSFATAKAVTPQWHQIFLRAIGCNWLVCIAVMVGISSREIASKIIGIWIPIATFVGLGFDHFVANMYFMPLAIFLGHPQITVGYYIWKSLIPSLLGNIVGAAVFVALPFWYFYLTGNEGVKIHFDTGARALAVAENTGPLALSRMNTIGTVASNTFQLDQKPKLTQMPDSHSHAQSGIAEDFSKEKYGKMHGSNSSEEVIA